MSIKLEPEICQDLEAAQRREWLVTNGIGGYASGTVAGSVTRGYHGLLVAALKPPLERTVLLTKVDDTAYYQGSTYSLYTNRWANGIVEPKNLDCLDRFYLEGTIAVWRFAFGDAILEKRIWMQQGTNTTYLRYSLLQATTCLTLSLKALVNYRSYHGRTHAQDWQMNVHSIERGIKVLAFQEAVPFYLYTDRGNASVVNRWCREFQLPLENQRGLDDLDDNLHTATFEATIEPGESLTFVASTQKEQDLNSANQLQSHRSHEQSLLQAWQSSSPVAAKAPLWIDHLVLAADQFVVDRNLPNNQKGKTIIAGYHWFTDWGRDMAIALPGLTLATGRFQIARQIMRTFAQYVDKGMLPNRFPDDDAPLTDSDYNTVDATLWYFEAIRAYYEMTGDNELIKELFPLLADIINWHCRGTRYQIKLDPDDGLLYAGEIGLQLTWMDVKIDDWVVTPRTGKPVEVNALWYNALHTIIKFAQKLDQPWQDYEAIAQTTLQGFQRFWNPQKGYCFDVLDSPTGNDPSLRPNQILAVSLPESPLTPVQQRQVVEVCQKELLTPYGLRSLAPNHPQYRGFYGGDRFSRDSAYHQGTVWSWLIGHFISAHLRVFQNPGEAGRFLAPILAHLDEVGLGSISEIFDGNPPMEPKGCIAQAWSVAEVLRAWLAIQTSNFSA